MSDDAPDRPPAARVVRALDVPRNARAGVAVGFALAVVVYAFRVFEVLGPFAGSQRYPVFGPEGWFLLLAFVLASTTAMLVTVALTLASAYRLARRM